MMRIPARFERVAAAFDEAAAAERARSYESSGSEHSADLSGLVNSFLEREIREQRKTEEVMDDGNEIDDDDELEGSSRYFENRDLLKSLFHGKKGVVRRSIYAEVEKFYRESGAGASSSSPEFKRRLMAWLRSRGFNAGLCKSKWEKNGRCPAGNYEYVDVNTDDRRYIIEVFPAGDFTIARPTSGYAAVLEVFPQIFVAKPDELKQVVKLTCASMIRSMKSAGIHIPPWRRRAYMQSKWFAAYKRTTNEFSIQKSSMDFDGDLSRNQRAGFAPVKGILINCTQGFAAAGGGFRIGNLTAALNQ